MALRFAVDLPATDPAVNSAHILDAADLRGQFPPDDLKQLRDDCRCWKP
jgi:hypothetical protein